MIQTEGGQNVVYKLIIACSLSTEQSVYLQEVSSPGQEFIVSKLTRTTGALWLV